MSGLREEHGRRLRALTGRLAVFNASDYLALNTDLGPIDPAGHFADQGVWEGRLAARPERLTAELSRAISLVTWGLPSPKVMEEAYRSAARLSVTVRLPTQASSAEEGAADRLGEAFQAVGTGVALRTGPGADGEAAVVISPARTLRGLDKSHALSQLRDCLAVVIEHPAQPEFQSQLPYLMGAAGWIAPEAETYAMALRLGISAVWFGAAPFSSDPPTTPDHPLLAGLSGRVRAAASHLPWRERPVDVVALDPASPARFAAWGRMVEGMLAFETVVQAPPPELPIPSEVRRFLFARSKVVLHLEEQAPRALPWELAAEVAGSGAVLVTEPSLPHPLLRPDVHHFASSARRMPALVERLIRSDEGAEAAVGAAAALRRMLETAFNPEILGVHLVSALLQIKPSA